MIYATGTYWVFHACDIAEGHCNPKNYTPFERSCNALYFDLGESSSMAQGGSTTSTAVEEIDEKTPEPGKGALTLLTVFSGLPTRALCRAIYER